MAEMRMRRKWYSLKTLIFGILALALVLFVVNSYLQKFYQLSSTELSMDSSQRHLVPLNLPKINKIGGDSANLNRGIDAFKQDLGLCKIPKLDLNGTDVMKHYKKFPPLDCSVGVEPSWLYVDDERKMMLTEYAKTKLKISDIECNWRFYERVTDSNLRWHKIEKFKIGEQVTKGDYFVVNCQASAKKWTNAFMTITPNHTLIEQLKQKRNKLSKQNKPLNVYVISFDSLSQMAFRRNLPKTVDYLERVMKSAVFNGYNIVGDGTPQAFIPIFTGATEEELPLTRKRYKEASFVDDVYPFIWRNFSDAGYATLYGEDGWSLGTFTYRLKGFRQTPTNHFPITFFQHFDNIAKDARCIGDELQHKVWFRYMKRFWHEYKEVSRFALTHHSQLSHDDMNRVQLADEDLRAHLEEMFESGMFDQTMVIVMADHGHRFSVLRETHQGQLEERLPFFSVHLPSSVRDSEDARLRLAWENLKRNTLDRLVTPFDVYSTLMDTIRWPLSKDLLMTPHKVVVADPKETLTEKIHRRSLSFFREIPLTRTCDQAGIEPHWCTCLNWIDSKEAPEVKTLAESVVQTINEHTSTERKLCSKLDLAEVVSAKKLVPNEKLLKYSGVKDKDGFVPELGGKVQVSFATYQIILITKPGNAKYEVTLFYDGSKVTVDMTAISHINKYGDRPHCIIDRNYFLAAYCVCYDRITDDEKNGS